MSASPRRLARRTRVPHWRAGVTAFVLVSLLAAAGSGAAAYWTTSAQSLGGGATAATVSVTTSTPTALTKQYKFIANTQAAAVASADNLAIAPLVFTNTSTSPLTLSLALSANSGTLAGHIGLTLWAGSGGVCASTVPSSNTVVTTLAATAPAMPSTIAAVAVGASVTLCAATKLDNTVATYQGQSVSPVLSVTGTVGNWTAAASTPPFVQSVYQVLAIPAPSCANKPGVLGLGGYVTLGWPAVTGATSYTLHKDAATALPFRTITPTAGSTAAISTDVNAGDLGLIGTGTVNVYLVSHDSLYGTTGVPTLITLRHGLLPLLTVQCPL